MPKNTLSEVDEEINNDSVTPEFSSAIGSGIQDNNTVQSISEVPTFSNNNFDKNCELCSDKETKCYYCTQKEHIENVRTDCYTSQKQQAQKMLQASKKKIKLAEVGMTVTVPIPDVDRCRGDHRNILAVITAIEDDGFYRLGTMHGMLKQLFSRNQFEICKNNFLSINDVKIDSEITLRGAVGRYNVLGNTQGYVRCQCTKRCTNKKCKCVSMGYTCNSKCHNSTSCLNK